jgi:mxaJ protein
MCFMSLDFRRRHLALAGIAAVCFIAVVVFSWLPSRVPRYGVPTEIVVQAEEIPPALATSPSPRTLRVCADPNNLPFSNARGEGFENKLAELTATALGRQLQYYWQPQRRGFIRSTLRAGTCDVVMGTLAGSDMVLTTRSYYRSSYVFVSRQDRHFGVRSFDDPRLRRWRIGIQLTGEDYGNPPPAQALASRHILQNVRGYTVYGDYSKPNPQRNTIAAVLDGTVDLAIVWGPIAGYFGRQAGPPLDITTVSPLQDGPNLPLAFDISMAVRRDDEPLAGALNTLIAQRRADIRRILEQFHVPLIATAGRNPTCSLPECL